jgi:hypothetical protein
MSPRGRLIENHIPLSGLALFLLAWHASHVESSVTDPVDFRFQQPLLNPSLSALGHLEYTRALPQCPQTE